LRQDFEPGLSFVDRGEQIIDTALERGPRLTRTAQPLEPRGRVAERSETEHGAGPLEVMGELAQPHSIRLRENPPLSIDEGEDLAGVTQGGFKEFLLEPEQALQAGGTIVGSHDVSW
jgi:hypothetical protein